jgi:glycosyltransferase involved in cell wall biosynthesis
MHVLQCFKTALPLTYGGIEQVMHHIAKGLVQKGHQSTILTFAKQSKTQVLDYEGYQIVVVPSVMELASMPISMAGFSEFKRLAKTADVIHYQYPFPWMDLMHVVHPPKKPSVLSYHSDIVKQKNLLKVYKPLQNLFLKKVSAIVSSSPVYAASSPTLSRHQDKLHCIPLGLDEHLYPKPNLDLVHRWREKLPKKFMVFIGVFRYYKGLRFLLEALKGLDYPLVLIGEGPEMDELKKLKTQYQLNHTVFLGALTDEDKNAVLSLSSGLVLPSHLRSEAFGLALVEGAMFGKPLISCEIATGTSYINLDKQTGWVVDPANPESLRQALIEWYENDDLCKLYGENARRRYEQEFQASMMFEKYHQLYQTLI